MENESPENELAGFIAKYTPEIATLAQAVLTKMQKRLPNALLLVYDNYNALAIGFSPTERASDAIFSIALFPRWVSLFFLQGVHLSDPQNRLKGKGKLVRHVDLKAAEDLDDPGIKELMNAALKLSPKSTVDDARNQIIIKSVSTKQRPRQSGKSETKKTLSELKN
jgi:hypothetical protein